MYRPPALWLLDVVCCEKCVGGCDEGWCLRVVNIVGCGATVLESVDTGDYDGLFAINLRLTGRVQWLLVAARCYFN